MSVERRELVSPAKWGLPFAEDQVKPGVQREQSYIIAIAVLTILAWQTQLGTLVLMPFTLLATWFHEMAHGLTAMALGADFRRLVIYPDGSGYAEYAGNMWGVSHAVTAAAGLFGPSVAGCAMIIASRSRSAARTALFALGIALVATTVIWVRSVTGWIVLPLFGLAAIAIAVRGTARWQRVALEFLGVQGAVSVWQDLGYLFSDGGTVGGRYSPSDTGAIADALFLPYWVWGTLITAAIVTMVWQSLKFAARN